MTEFGKLDTDAAQVPWQPASGAKALASRIANRFDAALQEHTRVSGQRAEMASMSLALGAGQSQRRDEGGASTEAGATQAESTSGAAHERWSYVNGVERDVRGGALQSRPWGEALDGSAGHGRVGHAGVAQLQEQRGEAKVGADGEPLVDGRSVSKSGGRDRGASGDEAAAVDTAGSGASAWDAGGDATLGASSGGGGRAAAVASHSSPKDLPADVSAAARGQKQAPVQSQAEATAQLGLGAHVETTSTSNAAAQRGATRTVGVLSSTGAVTSGTAAQGSDAAQHGGHRGDGDAGAGAASGRLDVSNGAGNAKTEPATQAEAQHHRMQALADSIREGLHRNDTGMRLLLSPPELGQVDVALRLRGGELFVTLQADQSGAAERLGQELHLLKAHLRDAGVTVADVDVVDAAGETTSNAAGDAIGDASAEASGGRGAGSGWQAPHGRAPWDRGGVEQALAGAGWSSRQKARESMQNETSERGSKTSVQRQGVGISVIV